MTKIIPLTQGKSAIVDDEDFKCLSQWKWCYGNQGYAKRSGPGPLFKTILMHRVIMDTPTNMDTDHINGDKLDNRRVNLRICIHSKNTQNRGINKNSTSGKIGVYRSKGKWRAVIKVNYQPIHLGYFDNLEDASRAFNEASKKYRGEFSKTNSNSAQENL